MLVLLDKFQGEIDDNLLKLLLEVYKNSLDLPQEERVDRLVTALKQNFEERKNEDHQP